MIDTYCASYKRPPRAVTLDIDDMLDVVHGHHVQVSTVVKRKRHPFEGCRLPVIRSLTRRGVLELLVVLPDGSRTLVPAAWTDWSGRQDAGLNRGRPTPRFLPAQF